MTRFFLTLALLVHLPFSVMANDSLESILRDIKAHSTKAHAGLTTPFLNEEYAKTTLSDFKGNALLVNFWATWCAPCVKEMPALDTLQAKYGKDGLRVISVSQDFGGLPKAKQFYERMNIQHMALYADDKNQLFNAFAGNSLPLTVLVDRNGNIVKQHAGFINWNGAKEQLDIQQLLAR